MESSMILFAGTFLQFKVGQKKYKMVFPLWKDRSGQKSFGRPRGAPKCDKNERKGN